MEALFMYRHPVVFDPILKQCFHTNQQPYVENSDVDNENHPCPYGILGDPELVTHEDYAKLCRDCLRITSIVGEVPPVEDAVGIAEGWINWRDKKPTPLGGLAELLASSFPENDEARTLQNQQEGSSSSQNVVGNEELQDHGRKNEEATFRSGRTTEAGEETAEYGRKRASMGLNEDSQSLENDPVKRPKTKNQGRRFGNDTVDEDLDMKIRSVGFGDSDDENDTTRDLDDNGEPTSTTQNSVFFDCTVNAAAQQYTGNDTEDEGGVGYEDAVESQEEDVIANQTPGDGRQSLNHPSDKESGVSKEGDWARQDEGQWHHGIDGHTDSASPALKLARRLFQYASPPGNTGPIHTSLQNDVQQEDVNDGIDETSWVLEHPMTQEWDAARTRSSQKRRRGKRERDHSESGDDKQVPGNSEHESEDTLSVDDGDDQSHDSDATAPMSADSKKVGGQNSNSFSASPAVRPSQESSKRSSHTSPMNGGSPNLLASSTPEKSLSSSRPSQPSQSTHESTSKCSSSATKPLSPNLLASSTPERSQSSTK
jgi:hypothetical protein